MRASLIAAMLAGLFAASMAAVPAGAAEIPTAPPELRLRDTGGRLRELGELKGKVVLVNFWASWCAPCREEMPALEELREKYGERGLEIVAVNFAESTPRIQSFLQAFLPDGVPFLVLQDRNGLAGKQWGVRALPASFLIDRAGLLRWKALGEIDPADDALQQRIEDLLDR